VSINLTLIGQGIAFAIFVLFCMKYVWPPLITAMRERQRTISEGLEKAVAAEKQLEEANTEFEKELEEAKRQAADLIEQARGRASQIVEEAKADAAEEAERIKQGAQAEIEQDINRAREALRARVGDLAVEGAEKILESSVDRKVHEAMLSKLAAQL